MISKRQTKIFTLITHSCIIIAAGHGIGIMAIIDIASILNIITDFIRNLNVDFNDKILMAGFISLIGKILLITSFFKKSNFTIKILEFFGIILLWISVCYLLAGDWNNDPLHKIVFFTSIPFTISSIVLILLSFEKK